ncbi:MAG: hypothetical protein ABW069_09940 [Duganella sp.]
MASMDMMAILNCALVAALAALCLYLAAPRQRLWPAALVRSRFLRWLAVPLLTGAVAAAAQDYGVLAGAGIALAGFAVTLLALPYADAWLQRGRLQKA